MKNEKIPLNSAAIIKQVMELGQKSQKKWAFSPENAIELNSRKHYVLKLAKFDVNQKIASKFVVVKLYNDKITDYQTRWQIEHEFYQKYGNPSNSATNPIGFRIPRLLDACPGVLILEYIEGINFADYYLTDQLNEVGLDQFIDWLLHFHATGLSFGDQRFRNFILTESPEIYGIDFEETESGNRWEDIAWFCANFLDHHFTEHFKFPNESEIRWMLRFLDRYCHGSNSTIPGHNSKSEYVEYWSKVIISVLRIIAARRDFILTDLQWKEISDRLIHGFQNYSFFLFPKQNQKDQ